MGNDEILMMAEVLSREKALDERSVFEAIEAALATATRKQYREEIEVRVEIFQLPKNIRNLSLAEWTNVRASNETIRIFFHCIDHMLVSGKGGMVHSCVDKGLAHQAGLIHTTRIIVGNDLLHRPIHSRMGIFLASNVISPYPVHAHLMRIFKSCCCRKILNETSVVLRHNVSFTINNVIIESFGVGIVGSYRPVL